jgi:hypothetical protein
MSTEQFIDESYEVPSSGGGFTKLEQGENKLRILSSPLMLWIEWKDGKVTRTKYDPNNKPAKGDGQKDSVKHGWALVVWNYKTEAIEVFELDKQDIIRGLTKHAKDADWGHPKKYDVIIEKKGSGMETEYSLVCKPPREAAGEIVDAFIENPVDLSKILTGDNPFLSNGGSSESTAPAAEAKKEVTAENWTVGDDIPAGFKLSEDGKSIEKKKMPF